MVIVLFHTVTSVCLWCRDSTHFQQRAIATEIDVSRMNSADVIQEAVLRLSGVCTYDHLEEAVKESLELLLPNVSDVVVYLRNPDGQDLVSSQGLVHTLPKEGITREVVEKRERLVVNGVDPSDPVSGLLKTGTAPLSRGRKVVCSPAVDRENEKVVALLMVACGTLSEEDHRNLSFLEKQLMVCCKRLKHSALPTTTSVPMHQHSTAQENNNISAILNLCAELYDQDAASLQIKVIRYLTYQTGCESGFLLLVDPDHRGELFCQVVGDQQLPQEIRFTAEHGTFTKAMKDKTPFSLDDLTKEQQTELEKKLSQRVESLLCVPVCSPCSGDVIAIACLVNKQKADRFLDADMEIVLNCFKYTATVLTSTLAVQRERIIKNQTQVMLQVAKNLFTQLDDLTNLLREIMQEARNLTKAERCSVFLLEPETNELVAKVFDGDVRAGAPQLTTEEVRIPSSQGIAGHVATTGELLNIDDAYSYPLFYRGVDESTGFKTRNILCFPIKDECGEIIGVAQLCNKINGAGFTSFDEEIAQAFSVYCCISIVHSLMYKRVRDAQHRSQLANELMIYHMLVSNEDVHRLSKLTIPEPTFFDSNMDKFCFIPRAIPYEDTSLAIHSMLDDMGYINKYRIKRDTLARFILMARRGYRDPPYHNWHHAFAVAHFCYLLYKNANLLNYLEDIEVFSLFISCICHDIDHRGTTNSYQVASQSVLAACYSSEGSVMERHHLAQTMCILNTEGCNIFSGLSKQNFEKVLDLIRDIILATDLAHHLKIMPDLEKITSEGYNKANLTHRSLLLCMVMTCCDLSDQTKHWKNSKRIAELIYQEFFSQGDMEKSLGRNPVEMMDRERAYIPELQISFLDNIALPVFKLLTRVFSDASVVVDAVENNHRMWHRMNEKVKMLQLVSNSSMDVFGVELEDDKETQA